MRKFAAGFAAISVVLLAACGGGSNKNEAADVSSKTTTAKASESSDGSKAGAELMSLLQKREGAKIRVTYKMFGNMGGTGNTTEITLSRDGDKFAYFLDDNQFIIDGDTVTMCTSIKTEPGCTQLTGEAGKNAAKGADEAFTYTDEALKNLKEDDYTDVSSETIAGRSATCATARYAGTSWKVCADKETGMVLKWEAAGDDQKLSFEATDVSAPKDSDFTPPATPETLPDYSNMSIPEG
jgi:hypothetical protein